MPAPACASPAPTWTLPSPQVFTQVLLPQRDLPLTPTRGTAPGACVLLPTLVSLRHPPALLLVIHLPLLCPLSQCLADSECSVSAS